MLLASSVKSIKEIVIGLSKLKFDEDKKNAQYLAA